MGPATAILRPLALALPVLFLAGCSNLFFVPMKELRLSPDDLGLDFENVFIDSSDGVRLYAWLLPAEGEARGTLLFLHGNAENISTHIGSVYWLPARGYNVLLLDYRGYGLSTGEPTLEGATADVQAGLRWLLDNPRLTPRRIVVLGQSLGGSLAVEAVARGGLAGDIRGLILDSAFADYRLIAREKLAGFWLTWPLQYPLSWTIRDDYRPLEAVARIGPTPLLIIHGDADRIIPEHHARLLFEAAGEPKAIWHVPGARHIGALHQPEIRDRLDAWLRAVLTDGGTPP